MKMIKKGAGFTLIELIIAVIMSAIIIFAILSVITFTEAELHASSISQGIQMDLILLSRQIAEGVFEPGGQSFGLLEAVSYDTLISGQVTFTGIDGNNRSFNTNATTVTYSSPMAAPITTIYKAPLNSILLVEFTNIANDCVGVNISITRDFNGRSLTGAISTSIYLRNVPQV